jgi:hypothetical protein
MFVICQVEWNRMVQSGTEGHGRAQRNADDYRTASLSLSLGARSPDGAAERKLRRLVAFLGW